MMITRLWRSQPGTYFCLSTKSAKGKWKDHFFKKEEFNEIRQFVKDFADHSIYFCPHGFSKARRVKQNAVPGTLLWSDMDEVDPRSTDLKPTIAIESSPDRYVGIWIIDETMDEELNRRLTYAMGADRSGWDMSQVLRLPGTINYKYSTLPRSRILWSDQAQWSRKKLEALLPVAEKKVADKYEASDASSILRRYERKLKATTRRELMTNKKPTEGKRSEVFLKMAFELLEAGMTKEEGCTLLKASVWNKYAGRRDEDKQISAAWDKATNKKLNAERSVIGESRDAAEPKRADQFEVKDTTWLWYPRIPHNSISLIGARGGTGKGLLCCDIVARVTTEARWPCSTERCEVGNVLWGEAEDKIEETLLARLIAAKADLSRVYFTKPSEFMEYDIPEFIRKHNIRLIILSPMISFLEGIEDANAAIDTRRALEHLDSVIQGTNCSIIGVMHLNKKPDLGAVERLLGSVEFANYPRSVLLLNKDEDQVVRMVHAKYNLGPKGDDLVFKSQNRRERTHPRGQFIGIDWDRPDDNVDSDSVFEKHDVEGTQSAGDWLLEFLSGGERSCADVFDAAEKASHTVGAIKRAKLRLGAQIKHRKERAGRVFWALSRRDAAAKRSNAA